MPGLVVGLVLPGYFLVNVLFVHIEELDGAERWGLAFVLNVVLVIGMALFLSSIHVRLTSSSVTVSMAALTLALTAMTGWRRHAAQRTVFTFHLPIGRAPWLLLCATILLTGITLVVVGGNLRASAPDFVITSADGRLSGYPSVLRQGAPSSLTLSLHNPTDQARVYQLIMSDRHDGRLGDQTIRIGRGGHWSTVINLPDGGPPRSEQVVFQLDQQDRPLRTLWIKYRIIP